MIIGLSSERPLYSFACQPYEKILLKTGRNTRVFLPADLVNLLAYSLPQFLLADFLTVTKFANRFTPPQFLLAGFLTVTKSVGRFTLPQFLLADFLTVIKFAGSYPPQFSISAGRFSHSHQICRQERPFTHEGNV